MSYPKITLITKTRTQNQGNQALSIAWRDYLASRYSDARVRLFVRAPKYLKRFTASTFASASDAVGSFDGIAHRLLERAPAEPVGNPSVWDVQHDPSQKQVIRFRQVRQALRLRSRLASLNVGSRDYLNRLSHLTAANLVVVNPAGEFQRDARDTALHYLLETRCAQLSGCRTAFVNLSFEVSDPMVIRIADHVFSHCDVLEFRDSESESHYTENGGSVEPTVLPDLAVNSSIERRPRKERKGLALAINALQVHEHGLAEMWDALVSELAQRWPVTLTSNEWTTDYPFWKRYLQQDGVTCDGQLLDYAEYARFLANFDVVVSSRLHTCVLGLVAGAAIVPVETGTFKLSGFFKEIGFPDEPVRMDSTDWQARLVSRVEAVRQNRESRIRLQDQRVSSARAFIRDGLDRLFPSALVSEVVRPGWLMRTDRIEKG